MTRRKVHLLYEYGVDLRPHSSAFIRLLRPLSHPSLGHELEVTAGLTYTGQPVEAVILERFWCPDISFTRAADLVEQVRRAGAKLIYTLDDNLLDVPVTEHGWFTAEHRWTVEFLLRQADGVIVSTEPLRERLAGYNPNLAVVPNALDERLLVDRRTGQTDSLFGSERLVIGYMGTLTHDADVLMILPALETVARRHPGQVEFQVVGGIKHEATRQALAALPLRVIEPEPDESEYPLFMLWFSGRMRWDIALAPLQDTPFTRCKSDIKFLDYCAIGAAGVYSRVPTYEASVRHGETGWLVENETGAWGEALEELLANAPLRKQLARAGTDYLYRERILAHRAGEWLEALEELMKTEEQYV